MPYTVLIVDDEPELRRAIARMLEKLGYASVEAASGVAALTMLDRDTPDLVLTDLSMPQMGGLALLEKIRERGLAVPAVVMSGAGTIRDAVEAVKLGAHDFIEKPVRPERLSVTLGSALRFARLADAHDALRRERAGDESLIGESPAMRELRAVIARVAPTDGRVLVTGENGTGKELVAAAIHAGSPRHAQPFVKVNCSAIPRELAESELFGHERGAFTGALLTRKGRFELADGGTLFLDEVGDMPSAMQVKLLRVLSEGQFERVGGTRTQSVDVRVIAATNRDLEAMIAKGEFREDLYYRLAVITIRTPPLRQRLDDVPALARALLERASERTARALALTDGALAALGRHSYPGNVRELSNVVERLAILCEGDRVDASDVERALPRTVSAADGKPHPGGVRFADLVADAERRILEETIAAHGGNRSAAARALGLERSHFHKKCRKVGVRS